eukprot:SAG11_NODE_10915_length_796_cov_32.292683_1_plen_69_part_00
MNTEEEKKLNELYDKIKKEISYIDIKSYSHNIISLTLNIMSEEFGQEKANETIVELGLDKLGWSVYQE